MGFDVLADEHTERRVAQSLQARGHDVELVVDVLGVGVDDDEIATYARVADRLILTSDTDFLSEFSKEDHAGVLFRPHDRLPATQVATIVTNVAEHAAQEDVDGIVYLTTDWL